MCITNSNDQKAIRQSVESAGDDIVDELPGLTPGQAIISGDAMNTPVLARVRQRYTEHGADSLNATSEWRDSWEDHHAERNRDVVDAYDDDEGIDDTAL